MDDWWYARRDQADFDFIVRVWPSLSWHCKARIMFMIRKSQLKHWLRTQWAAILAAL